MEDCVAGAGCDSSGDVDARIKSLHDFMAASLPKSRHQMLSGVGSTLMLSVHHHNPSMRRAAITKLGKSLMAKGKVCVMDYFPSFPSDLPIPPSGS
jgi:hypothetical protein